jgi:MFS superfamily sulfate permease-like transporter
MSMLTLGSMPTSWAGAPLPELSAAYAAVAALLAFTTGALQLLLAWLQLGFLSTALISEPVMSGFVSGSAFLSISSQAATLLGLPKCGKAAANGLGGYACNFAQVRGGGGGGVWWW